MQSVSAGIPTFTLPQTVGVPRPQSLLAPAATSGDTALIGDRSIVLDGVRKVTDFLDRHPVAGGAVVNTFAMMKAVRAFPKFIYPTVTGATPQEHKFLFEVLDTLPLKDVNSIKSLHFVETIPGASGTALEAQVTNVVQLARDQISIRPEWFREVAIHETGHTKDYESAWFGFFGHHSDKAPFGEGPYVSDYAKTNAREDFAESYAEYHMNPDRLKQVAPEKYAVVHESEQQNFMERMIDQEAFRETGKWVGEHMPSQGVRTGVQVLHWATGGVQLLVGLDKIRKSTEEKDTFKHFDGVLDVAAGALISSKIGALGGIAVHGANRALKKAIERKQIDADDADAAVRIVSDPVERGIRAVGSKVGMAAFKDTAVVNAENADHKGLALSIGIGGSVGALAGGFAGPYAGIMAGYSIGGPVGGAIGLLAGGLAGYTLGSSIGGRVGGAVGNALGL